MKLSKFSFTSILLILSVFCVKSQYTSNTFFLEANPLRQQWNPSLVSTDLFYLALPYVGDMQLNIGNNAYSVSDFVPQDWRNRGNLFVGPFGNKLDFYNQLNGEDLVAEGDYKLNYIDFGYKWKGYFLTFAVKERFESQLLLPNTLEKFVLIGNGFEEEYFDFSELNFNMTHFTETTFGIAGEVKKFKWGSKLKVLSGLNNITVSNGAFDLKTSIDYWDLEGSGRIQSTFPAGSVKLVEIDSVTSEIQYQSGTYFKPFGLGLGIDLGISMEVVPNLELSAAALDLGFFRWKRNLFNVNYSADYQFDGIQDINLLFDNVVEAYKTELELINQEVPSAYSIDTTSIAYTTRLSPRYNFGAVYYFQNHKYSAGVLTELWSVGNRTQSKMTFGFSANPLKWLNLAASYTNYNNNLNLLGFGVDVFYKNFNFLLSTDYFLPSKYFTWDFRPDGTSPFTVLNLPYETNQVNLSLNVSYVIPEKKKSQVCNCYTRD